MFERFTPSARAAVIAAASEAERRGDGVIGTDHLVAGLLSAAEPTVAASLAGIAPADLHRAQDALDTAALRDVGIDLGDLPDPPSRVAGGRKRFRFSAAAKQTISAALREAVTAHDRHIGAEHILLALTDAPPRDRAVQLLRQLDVDVADLRSRLLDQLRRSA